MSVVKVLGITIHGVTMKQAVLQVEQFIKQGGPHLVATANSEMVLKATHDILLGQVLEKAHLVVPDGIGVVWAAKVLGTPVPERVPGIDLMQEVLKYGAPRGWKVFLLGAQAGIPEIVKKRIEQEHPGVQVVGYHHGYFAKEEEAQVCAKIQSCAPDILFVALGMPRQEKWAAGRLAKLKVPVAIGVGGSFNVLAGVDKRAPKWMQKAGLEWFYRLIRQPWRVGRMASLPQFALMVLLDKLVQKEEAPGE